MVLRNFDSRTPHAPASRLSRTRAFSLVPGFPRFSRDVSSFPSLLYSLYSRNDSHGSSRNNLPATPTSATVRRCRRVSRDMKSGRPVVRHAKDVSTAQMRVMIRKPVAISYRARVDLHYFRARRANIYRREKSRVIAVALFRRANTDGFARRSFLSNSLNRLVDISDVTRCDSQPSNHVAASRYYTPVDKRVLSF